MRPKGSSGFCTFVALVVLGCERAEPSREEATEQPSEPTHAAGPSAKGVPAANASGVSGGVGSEGPSLTRAGATSGASCRVMSVSGAAQREGVPLRAGDTLDRQQAVELGAGSTLHLVHTASARQWTLTGLARAFACERGAEEIVLARGTLRTEPGSGVRPGAEVWVGTPFGSLRYSDARAELEVTPEALRVQVSRGSVWLSPLGDESTERELTAGTTTYPARAYRLASAAAAARCESAARAAEALATALLSPSTEPLGARAREHVRARQRAHASCSSALATLLAGDAGGAPDSHAQAGYSALAEADRLWRGVPARSPPFP
jgi:hypothetical protein